MTQTEDLVPIPTRDEIASWMSRLLDGTCTRREAHDWAAYWTVDHWDVLVPQDKVAWRALEILTAADLMASPDRYELGANAFRDTLASLAKPSAANR
jgi:ferric-dicitrate binding protein FerR (iron transport regulator)